MGLPTVNELIARTQAARTTLKMTEAEFELQCYEEGLDDQAEDLFIELMKWKGHFSRVAEAAEARYGNLMDFMTIKERMRTYRHYLRKVLAEAQRDLDSHRARHPHRFKVTDHSSDSEEEMLAWCKDNLVKPWDVSSYFGQSEISFADETEAAGFYFVFGGSQVVKA